MGDLHKTWKKRGLRLAKDIELFALLYLSFFNQGSKVGVWIKPPMQSQNLIPNQVTYDCRPGHFDWGYLLYFLFNRIYLFSTKGQNWRWGLITNHNMI